VLFHGIKNGSTSDLEKFALTLPILDFLAERKIEADKLWHWLISTRDLSEKDRDVSFLARA